MRILFWSDTFYPSIGGVEVFAARLIPALRRRGHELLVISRRQHESHEPESCMHGTRVYRFPFTEALGSGRPARILRLCKELARIKRDFRPDLVHCNSLVASTLFHVRTAASAPVVPSLLSMHGNLEGLDTSARSVTGQAIRSAKRINCCSRAILADLVGAVPEVESRTSVIYYGLDPAPAPPAPRPSEPRLLCLGRLVREKGFDLALDAFSLLSVAFPGAHLTIAGDGPAAGELAQQAVGLGLRDRVRFTGWVAPADIATLLDACSLLIVPSRWREAFGLVALEAALRERPVVASGVGGLAEAIEDGVTGILVANEDSRALAEGVVSLLRRPSEADALGRRARERALRRFSWARCVDAYEALYREVLGE